MLNQAVPVTFTVRARQVGITASAGTAVLIAVYATTLIAGLLSLKSPEQPIGDPWFSILEILIILIMPLLVALNATVHAWAPPEARVFSLLSIVFVSLLAGLTSSVHFVILTLRRQPEFAAKAWMPMVLSFKWPSVSYALDILAWDVIFALSVLCAAPVFSGNRLAASIRALLAASGVLALAGLSGVIFGDMRFRNIGVIGYAGVFPVAAVLLAIFFYRVAPHRSSPILTPIASPAPTEAK
jgi:hypothetical protein